MSDGQSARRVYRMRKRQEDVADTRRRIVDAAVQLHGSVGPAQTTFSAVADLAGVQRSTVYRHFADEQALFGACTSHWLAGHPWPRPDDWRQEADAEARLGRGLRELYRYYAANEAMLANSYRDIEVMPQFVGELMGAQLAAMQDALLEAWSESERGDLAPLIGFALDFRAWQALRDAGMEPGEAAASMARMVCGTRGNNRHQQGAIRAVPPGGA